MIRAVLSLSLGTLALGLGLWTCLVQNENHARARALARLQRQWEMVEAANQQAEAIVESHVWGEPNDPAAVASGDQEVER